MAELAHTLVVVKPPAGKLNDCADADRTEKGFIRNTATPSTANDAQVRIGLSPFNSFLANLRETDEWDCAAPLLRKEVPRLRYLKVVNCPRIGNTKRGKS